MKPMKIIYYMMALCLLALSSCGPDNVDYANKVVGNYNVKITPNLTLTFDENTFPSIAAEIVTTASITKDDELGNVTIKIKGVNGSINDIEMKAYCSGLGMAIEDSEYKGIIASPEYGAADCNFTLKNPTTSISNARIFTWNSTVSGTCEVNYVGLDIKCNTSGAINFAFTPITE